MSESFAELFEESLRQTDMSAGNVVLGTIADISDGYVIVSAGLKSEGVIPVAQFMNLQGEIEVS
ncbi:MAG: 30S ribosomal protein S1, partial [Proteobacteria bacterium]|nr:30S ribosomal protein S1 [Pseudomonadota bacterium]